MSRRVSLEDKYALEKGRVYLTGTQALVRLALLQHQRDALAGLKTAAFVSGYRGSPLGNLDRELWRARRFLDANQVHFQPGINEDLAATAVWGSQQVGMFPGARFDGVYGMWYGKGPGVDRSGDVLRHANFAGTAPNGGVLALAGDDPACKSSTVPSQSEYAFMDAQIPVLNPANVQDLLDLGVFGWALSRFSGLWVGLKTITENMDSSASVIVDPQRLAFVVPEDFEMPDGGLHIRWPDTPLEQELRLQRHKLYAALAFARVNRLDRVVVDAPDPRFGIVTTGKSYLDVMQALEDLGIDEAHAAEIGIRVYKVGMSWPLERDGMRAFAEGLDEILVVEEKRAVIENQLKEQLYNWRADVRPQIVGKFDERGEWVLPSAGELTPARIARVIAARIDRFYTSTRIKERLAFLEDKEKSLQAPRPATQRVPYFCSGCPHNTSTRVPKGSRAVAGIGCHYMATWMDRSTATFTHMGGEGANWIGQAPFTEEKHIFVNLGDGTYYHSGLLAIRAAVAAKARMTYKILFNDAVAMTGGQPVDGPLDPAMISRQVAAEGVEKIVVVSDDPGKYPVAAGWAKDVRIHHRDELDSVQRDLSLWPGVSVLIYDQTCAAEKRRRRKRGLMDDPSRRVFINEAVCEGCGDCGAVSNCVSIVPVETEYGRKRAIDQSSCNKDYSCVNGFCPSFVSVIGATPRRREGAAQAGATDLAEVPEPDLPALDHPYGIIITGIGGTGVVTVGALLGMAAHIEGKGVSVLDMTGLAQKNGAVISHVRLAADPGDIHAVRIPAGGADALLGCDLVTAGSFEALAKLRPGLTRAVVNDHATMTAEFTRNPDAEFPGAGLRKAVAEACANAADFIDASNLATALLGDAIASNLFLVGYAWQKGLVPIGRDALEEAIRLNGVAVDFNLRAFDWGRRAAVDRAGVEALAEPQASADPDHVLSQTLAESVDRRAAFLAEYQDAAYGERFRRLVERARTAEAERTPGMDGLADAVARGAFKLMAIKDEYEVARLYADPAFKRRLDQQFDGDYSLRFHMAPPFLAPRDPETGQLRKLTFGPWLLPVMRLVARMRGLRNSRFDPFGRTAERRMERALLAEYEETVAELVAGLRPENHAAAVELAALPLQIKGFGHIKRDNADAAAARRRALLDQFRNPPDRLKAAE